jgi:hypothetical protein
MHTFHTLPSGDGGASGVKDAVIDIEVRIIHSSVNAGLFVWIAPITYEKNGRRDANAAEIVRRKKGLVECLWIEYAVNGGYYRQSCGKNFRSGMREMGWVRGGSGLTAELGSQGATSKSGRRQARDCLIQS